MVLSLAFTVAFSVFLVAFVDWRLLMKCSDESSCGSVASYIIKEPFIFPLSLYATCALTYLILCLFFLVWRCILAVKAVKVKCIVTKVLHLK